MRTVKNLFWILLTLITMSAIMTSCTRKVYVPVEHVKTVTVTKHDTIVKVELEREEVKISTNDTTAHAETKYATASATWSGETETLSLDLKNKNVAIDVKTEYIETIITDSIPVPYEVIKIEKERYVPLMERIFSRIGMVLSVILLVVVFVKTRNKWTL